LSDDRRLLDTIAEMAAEIMTSPEIYRPSAFWEGLNEQNRRQISEQGFESFKHTVNQNYFAWLIVGPRHSQFRKLLRSWLAHPDPHPLFARLVDGHDVEVRDAGVRPLRRRGARFWHGLFVALLWDFARRHGAGARLDVLQEPSLGRPIVVRHRGRLISQDLANSALEVAAIEEALSRPLAPRDRIIEFGAGYGRLAWFVLELTPGARYVIVDIPPALAISQEYLGRLFPQRRIFRFRHFDSGDSVAAELETAEIAFLTPNQLDLVAPLAADVFVTISTLPEMRPEQVANVIRQVGRHTEGIFYMKQWRAWANPIDGGTIGQRDYVLPASWRRLFERDHLIQSDFFEAGFGVGQGETRRRGLA
jgi:putative sugar O-methyltransferase